MDFGPGAGTVMFRQDGPFVTIITASGGAGLTPCGVDDWQGERGSRIEASVEGLDRWPQGGRRSE